MKLATLGLVLFTGIPLIAGTYPVGNWERQQQQLPFLPRPSVNSVDSFDGGSSVSSSSSRESKSRFLDILKPKHSSNFRCHSYPQDNVLSELAMYITNLFKSYQDELFSRKGDPERIPLETCLAGYDSVNVWPSIYLSSMTKRQTESVTKLLKNQVVKKYPNFKVVTTGKGIALVQDKGNRIERRVTV
ncbi:MAG: hypothetical protein Q9201_006847 [Fulgogasparrea decipioides]